MRLAVCERKFLVKVALVALDGLVSMQNFGADRAKNKFAVSSCEETDRYNASALIPLSTILYLIWLLYPTFINWELVK